MCSIILHGTDVSDTGLQLHASFLHPFLKTGVTLACGTWTDAIDWLKIKCRNGATSSAASFSSQHEIPSGPLAFLVLMFLSSLTISSSWISTGSISEILSVSMFAVVVVSSSVNTALNCSLRISALALLSFTSAYIVSSHGFDVCPIFFPMDGEFLFSDQLGRPNT